jgi:cobaltochelatase CobN
MQKSSYAGAREMSEEIEHLYGFQKTAPDHLDSGNWQKVMDIYVKIGITWDCSGFFNPGNPTRDRRCWLLEGDRQCIYEFSPKNRALLAREYARTIIRDGAACNAQVCRTATLRGYLVRKLRASGSVQVAARVDRALRRCPESKPSAPARPAKHPVAVLRTRANSVLQ